MKSKTELLFELWIESRTRFSNQLDACFSVVATKEANSDVASLRLLPLHRGGHWQERLVAMTKPGN